MAKKYSRKLELWGGIECSYNRVENDYIDQLLLSGHYERGKKDIEQIVSLGIKAMRYPVIWERLQSTLGGRIDWSWIESQLHALNGYGIKPVAGLVHHGSGPKYADILHPSFATGLADFAARVARKFPWIEYYTPVNEPLTTARFCGLYGLWFPHERNDRSFVLALLNEMKAIVMSMKAIRKINPEAKLVQTEDLGKTYSTPKLAYQARFENHRRWLTCDFLCGKVTPQHPLWSYLLRSGASEKALYFFIDNPCPPDIVGLDYYATSERYLDDDIEKYPAEKHGGNGRHRYADVEAFRVRHDHPAGIQVLLKECWERYRLPMVITEAHINCDPDNQIRWFAELRNACLALIDEGADIRAITAWALHGSYGWNKLLTARIPEYESGVFDVSSGKPEPTPIASYLREIGKDPQYIHPAQNEKGWWQQESRFIFEKFSPGELEGSTILDADCMDR